MSQNSAPQQEVFGANGRPRSMRIAPSMYPRFSQMSDDSYSALQRPVHNSDADSRTTSQASIYQSALDIEELRGSVIAASAFTPNRQRPSSCTHLMENMAQTEETTFMSPLKADSNLSGSMTQHEEFVNDYYFRDGIRKIDFVLTYTTGTKNDEENKSARDIFEKNLMEDGLHLEYEIETGGQLNFAKIHAPWEVLQRYAEIMKLKMPMKQMDKLSRLPSTECYDYPIHHSINHVNRMFPTIAEEMYADIPEVQSTQATDSIWNRITRSFKADQTLFKTIKKCVTSEYQRNKEFLFDIPQDKDLFFSSSERSRVVDFILKRKPFSMSNCDDRFAFGITRLLADQIYTAAYPLHEGDSAVWNTNDMRSLLSFEWASLARIHKMQPLDYIKDYFGVKIGLYFAWLGFYTYMLIPASVVGLICFIYGIATMYTYVPCNEICDKTSNSVMCPLCDKCNFWKLNESCIQSRITYLVDNPAMLVFAVFMSFWGAIFLELWKRYSSVITYNWDLTGFDQSEEHPRPEFLARLNKSNAKKKLNIITRTMEPYISFWRQKFPAVMVSISVVLLLTCIAIIAVVGVIIYRMSFSAILALQHENDTSGLIERNAPIITTASAAFLNLVCIMLLNQVYTRIAEKLTELEMPRTQSDYDDSLTLKMFLLQFVNYYASIFYIAFFKGKLVGYPGHYERLFGYRQEECSPGGCLMELAIQLSIIMVGKQVMNAVMEMFTPLLHRWWKACKDFVNEESKSEAKLPSWERDYLLFDRGAQGLFWEYLEMVLQFGFVTIFVTAFPLAPLFALLNNSFEMRLDGKKFLNLYRRQVARRVPSIGVWYRIMDCIGKLSVITNAFIIAFTSNFIPRLVYKYANSEGDTLAGYVNHSLSYFDVQDFDPAYTPSQLSDNITYCRYEDYREFPDPSKTDHEYKPTSYFWYILVIRLAFVVVFENVIILLVTIMRWLVPDVPKKVRDKIKRDVYLTNEIIVEHEAARARHLAEIERKRRSQLSDDSTLPSRAPLRKRPESHA